MRPLRPVVAALVGILPLLPCLAGCDQQDRSDFSKLKVSGDPADPVYAVGDALMDAAVKQAQASVDQFIKALGKPSPTQTYFSVKKPFPNDKGSFEHIWLEDPSFDGSQFHGAVGNTPAGVKGLKSGDRASVAKTEISDWMIIDDGRLIGGYTIRAFREKMSPEERAQFDRDFGVRFD